MIRVYQIDLVSVALFLSQSSCYPKPSTLNPKSSCPYSSPGLPSLTQELRRWDANPDLHPSPIKALFFGDSGVLLWDAMGCFLPRLPTKRGFGCWNVVLIFKLKPKRAIICVHIEVCLLYVLSTPGAGLTNMGNAC